VFPSCAVVARAHEGVAVAGMTAAFAQTCPSVTDGGVDWSGSYAFTATSSSIRLSRPTIGLIEVRVYTSKQVP